MWKAVGLKCHVYSNLRGKGSSEEQIKRSNQITNLPNRCNKPSVSACRNLVHIKNIINISNAAGKHLSRFISLKRSHKTLFF